MFVNHPPHGTLIHLEKSGETLLYHPPSNILAARTVEGIPKTMHKPINGIEEFYSKIRKGWR